MAKNKELSVVEKELAYQESLRKEQERLKAAGMVKESETIMPTMVDEDSDNDKRIDLSSIIPKGEKDLSGADLISRETELKSDGAVVIASVVNNELQFQEAAKTPEQIDMVQRKKDYIANQNDKKKIKEKTKKKKVKLDKKGQGVIALMSLVAIAIIGFTIWYYKNAPAEDKFKVLTVTVELGDALPPHMSSYVTPGIGDNVSDSAYTKNVDKVKIDSPGDYEYTVSHAGKTKTGIIRIVDTTSPSLELREVTITEGDAYDAGTFVADCTDLTGCNFEFEEKDTESKYKDPGKYKVAILAKDAFNNQSIKQTTLIIEAVGMVKYFQKNNPFDFNKGYEETERYEIHFTNFNNKAIILKGIHTYTYKYQDEEMYKYDYKEFYGLNGYTFDDANLTIVKTLDASTVGNNYSTFETSINWLQSEGFSETTAFE